MFMLEKICIKNIGVQHSLQKKMKLQLCVSRVVYRLIKDLHPNQVSIISSSNRTPGGGGGGGG